MVDANYFKSVVLSRHSVRAFTTQSVDEATIRELLEIAAQAPSGTNIQPWQVYVVQGEKRQQIIDAVQQVVEETQYNLALKQQYQSIFQYYPKTWFEPYLSRRRQNGWGLYKLLNIQKGEKEKMHRYQIRNFEFFGAPVGLFFTAHKDLHVSAKMAIAMYMQTLMLTAKAYGLDTCAQAAWNDYHSVVMPLLGADEDQELICGMALGYTDSTQVINDYRTPRLKVEEFTTFLNHL